MVKFKVTENGTFYRECSLCGHIQPTDNTPMECDCPLDIGDGDIVEIKLEHPISLKEMWGGPDQDDVLPDDPDFWGL